jgi:tRNA threonylcarbamoyladenosine biosynthesis protein TsaB
MRILALDTTGAFGSIALYENAIVEEVPLHAPDGYGQVLFGHIARLLERHDWPVKSIACFAAANGPGSFTGVRVGIAAVKALAEATEARAIGVSNLQALAAYGSTNTRGVLMDARRGEVYASVYDADLCEISPEVVTLFPAWIASLDSVPAEIISPDITAFQVALPKHVTLIEQRSIASAVARIAACRLQRADPGDPLTLEANYVRRSDAELHWRDT